MSRFEDAIWTHLVEQHSADRVAYHATAETTRRPRPAGALASVALLAAAAIAVLLVLSASSGTPPAYALTERPDGSFTVSLYDIATGVPALNARFAALGIRITAVPVIAGCTASSFDPVQAAPLSRSQTVTVSNRGIPAGWRGFIAAERLPSGRIDLALGDTPRPIPSCFPTTTSHGIPVPPGRPSHNNGS